VESVTPWLKPEASTLEEVLVRQYSNLQKHFAMQPYDQNKIFEEFNKPIHENLFMINLLFLKTNSDHVSFNNTKWEMRPEVFCLDQYEDRFYFYPIILLVNEISTIFNFTRENLKNGIIIAPLLEAILKFM